MTSPRRLFAASMAATIAATLQMLVLSAAPAPAMASPAFGQAASSRPSHGALPQDAPSQTRAAAPARTAPIFRFETDELWLNLHHFLYVLGRAEARLPDASREAVAGAPAEADRGLATLSDGERTAWREVVRAYATGLSRKDAIFDAPLPSLAHALARAGDADTLGASSDRARQDESSAQDASTRGGATQAALDPATRALLERAAPIYRKAWWPAHRAGNRAWRVAMQTLVDRHGAAVLAFLTRAYDLPWSADGYPVHLTAYSNWAGAYSTDGELLVVSTSPSAGQPDLLGLELVFHEGMHQWDDPIQSALAAQARATGQTAPDGLSHALIFFTAGEAVRRIAPAGHSPYAEAKGVWQRGVGVFRPALIDAWQPYLQSLDGRESGTSARAADRSSARTDSRTGSGTGDRAAGARESDARARRDAALAALIARAAQRPK